MRYYKLDWNKSLTNNLIGCCIIEFPTFHIFKDEMPPSWVEEKPILNYFAQQKSDIREDNQNVNMQTFG